MNKTNPISAQPPGGLQAGHSGIILQDVVDEETEDSGLRRHIEKLRRDAQSEVLAPEHVPVPGDGQESRHIGDDQQSIFRRLEQRLRSCAASVQIRPRIGAMKKYSNPQTAANTMAIQACCPPVGLSRVLPRRRYAALIFGVQVGNVRESKNDNQQNHEHPNADVRRRETGIGIHTAAS